MRPKAIDKEKLLDRAYAIAEERGISHLSIRELAKDCGVSVGSIYNCFGSKANVTGAVIERFFVQAFDRNFCEVQEGERFVDYARRLATAMREAFNTFEADWLGEIHKLPAAERAQGDRMRAYLHHVVWGMEQVLAADTEATVPKGVEPEALCTLVLDGIMASLRGKVDADTLLALIESALYR